MRFTSSTLLAAAAPLLLFTLPSLVTSQSGSVLDTIPQCYQDCIRQSGDFTCNGLDIKCLCRLSNGNFLTNVITCIRANCDNDLNTSSLVQPVAETCAAYGVPIAPAAIANAQSIASALGASSTLTGATTVTSTIASAGTMYVIAVPLSASSGRSGVRTSTGSISTVTSASISGGSAVTSTSRATTTASSTTTEETITTTTASATQSASAAGPSVTSSGGDSQATSRATPGGNGSPFSNAAAASMMGPDASSRWLVALVCSSVLILGLLLS